MYEYYIKYDEDDQKDNTKQFIQFYNTTNKMIKHNFDNGGRK